MSSAIVETPSDILPSSPKSDGSADAPARLIFLAILCVWLPAIDHLRHEWWINEQYQFGLVVPFLAAYLFTNRWDGRPAMAKRPSGILVGLLITGLLAAFLPLGIVQGVNPDWRMLGWVYAGFGMLVSMLVVAKAGGAPWVRHFAFPIAFILVAIPWPMQMENSVMAALMQWNAGVCTEILNLAGFPAVRLGNVIDIGGTRVGVEEACSGVRSLQTTLMMGLLFGDLGRFQIPWRIALVVAGAIVAVAWNLVRTMTLVALSAAQGNGAVEHWHDRVGLAVLVCCFVSMVGLAKLFGTFSRGAEAAGAGETKPPLSDSGLGVPKTWCWAIIIWIGVVLAAPELWYLPSHNAENRFTWSVEWPRDFAEMREVPIAKTAALALRYDTGVNKEWRDDSGRRWSAFLLDWGPGRNAKLMARSHRPDACLPRSGKIEVAAYGDRPIQVNGVELHFRHYQFDDQGVPLHVFFGIHSAVGGAKYLGPEAFEEGLTLSTRLDAVKARVRDRAQRQLELAVWGVHDKREALDLFAKQLEKLIRVEGL